MFDPKIYKARREELKKKLKSGVLLFVGNDEAPMNYKGNTYAFRQDSSFLYYFGLDLPGMFGVIDLDNDKEILFGYEFTIDDVVWMGPQPKLAELSEKIAVANSESSDKLADYLSSKIKDGVKIHYLPVYRGTHSLKLGNLLNVDPHLVEKSYSLELTKAVVEQRSIKQPEEIKEIQFATEIAYEMHTTAMKMAKPGIIERDISGTIEGISLTLGSGLSFPPIVSVNGQTLHNHYHGNQLKEGDLLVVDSGAESLKHYASDITRTTPVGGKFSDKQKSVYQAVLTSQKNAIENTKPGITNLQLHLGAAKDIAKGLSEIGLMKGNIDDAIEAGAHALFFPHGLGHMMGLDVHDMEGLGENLVGYNDKTKRSDQFGLAYLRLAKELKPGYVFTIEPGCYFIPELIDMWKAEGKHKDFIIYDEVEKYKDFGGIRIEDNILVTEDGYKIFGSRPIPKEIKDVEELASS